MADGDNHLYRLIGDRIRLARESSRPRLSQARLAERLGMSRVSIVNIEAGRQRAPVHVLWAIAQELGIELQTLLPRLSDHADGIGEVRLDADVVAKIEEAANGDPSTKKSLVEFISRAKTQLRPTGEGQ